MWDRTWIRDAVVATTVRVGVRTLAALRMFPARQTFTRRCGGCLQGAPPAAAYGRITQRPLSALARRTYLGWPLQSPNRLRVVRSSSPRPMTTVYATTTADSLLRVRASAALRAASRSASTGLKAAWRGWQDATTIDQNYAPRPPSSSTTAPTVVAPPLTRLLKMLSKFTQHGEPETRSIGTTKLLRLIP